jgi:hypothetical protein
VFQADAYTHCLHGIEEVRCTLAANWRRCAAAAAGAAAGAAATMLCTPQLLSCCLNLDSAVCDAQSWQLDQNSSVHTCC